MKIILIILLICLSLKAEYSYKTIDKFHLILNDVCEKHKLIPLYLGREKDIRYRRHGHWVINASSKQKIGAKPFVVALYLDEKSKNFIEIEGVKVYFSVTNFSNERNLDITKLLKAYKKVRTKGSTE